MSSIGLHLPSIYLTRLYHPDLGYAVTQKSTP